MLRDPSPASRYFLLRRDAATDHVRGSIAATNTVIEYGDFACPYCRQAHSALRMLLEASNGRTRLIFRHFPLIGVHPYAEYAAEAAEAAGAQGKFWQMHDLLFEHRLPLDQKQMDGLASGLGLDMARFHNEMSDQVYLQRVQEHVEGGEYLGVRSTPTFFVNGVLADVSLGLESLRSLLVKLEAAV